MSFKTRVAYVKTMKAGETLYYKRAYILISDSIIATVACGYSDGYPAIVVNKVNLLFKGRSDP